MINQDEKTQSGKITNLREIAEAHVIEKDGKWMLTGFDSRSQVQGINLNQTYETRQQALEAAVNLLHGLKAA